MLRRTLIALAVAGLAGAPLTAQSVKAGIEAWQRSDYSGAVAIWRPLAEKGDADAAFNLGQAYRLGRGVATNLAAAQTWFERAAEKGHLDAQATLGLLLFQNNDQAGGLKWLKAAAEQGEARALLVYGTALFNGDGVTQDPILGYAYVSRAAAQGLAPAKDTLAELDKILPLEDRKKGVALAMAKAKTTPAPASRTAKAAPKPKPAQPAVKPPEKAAASKAPASGDWRIQVGAFDNRSAAEAAYRKLEGKAALAGRSPQYMPFKQFIRLRIGPFASKAAAQSACNALKQACFPVAPGK
jgi:TPR repeat protein